jgi:hypothetical protein
MAAVQSLTPSTTYNSLLGGFGFHPAGSGTDLFEFDYTPPPYVGGGSDSATNLSLDNTYSSLTVNWCLTACSGAGILNTFSLSPGSAISNQALTVHTLTAGTYFLQIVWTAIGEGGTYTDNLTAFAPRFEPPAVPLPPAIALFGSALLGVGLLGRRRTKEATKAFS